MLRVAARGDGGDLRAGLYGRTWGGCGYIELLWVREDQRRNGLEPGYSPQPKPRSGTAAATGWP